MIILLCGPSGSGKTTLLSQIAVQTSAKIIEVTVCRAIPRKFQETGKREVDREEFEELKSNFQYLNHYDGADYGYSILDTDFFSPHYTFLDYPGEYPTCPELKDHNWRGMLVLPPNRAVLIDRLIHQNKSERIPSALSEYDEILDELRCGKYAKPQWFIFYSHACQMILSLIADISSTRLFAN